jgi:ArsR family transcriptional regulator
VVRPESFFKQLSDATRLHILMLLQTEGELCVCEFSHAMGLSQPKISRHLALLRDSGIVVARRSAKWVYYRINEALPGWMQAVIEHSGANFRGERRFEKKRQRLKTMSGRPQRDYCD